LLAKETWDDINTKINSYKYTSIQHIEYEDIINAVVLQNDTDVILLLDTSKSPAMLYFATNSIEKALDQIDLYHEEVRINFIPHDFIELFKKHGFIEWAEYGDFFNEDIQRTTNKLNTTESVEFLCASECSEVSVMSKECAMQSRGFTGESPQWFADWIRDNKTIIIKNNDKIIGFCCVSIYANGTMLWIREIAVSPRYQMQGYGKKLMEQAIRYGADKGAKRGFLAADILNKNAIGLYNLYDFHQKDSQGELQMMKVRNAEK
jgi:GNAT superfamily N-acetyltransferase